jgi:hypothetical protein
MAFWQMWSAGNTNDRVHDVRMGCLRPSWRDGASGPDRDRSTMPSFCGQALFVCSSVKMTNKNLARFRVPKRGENLARASTKQIQAMHQRAISRRSMML